jgi:hypothetical protein
MRTTALKNSKVDQLEIISNIVEDYISTYGLDFRTTDQVVELTSYVSAVLKKNRPKLSQHNDNKRTIKNSPLQRKEVELVNKVLRIKFIPFIYSIDTDENIDEFITEFETRLLLVNDKRNQDKLHNIIEDYLLFYHFDIYSTESVKHFNDWLSSSIRETKLIDGI